MWRVAVVKVAVILTSSTPVVTVLVQPLRINQCFAKRVPTEKLGNTSVRQAGTVRTIPGQANSISEQNQSLRYECGSRDEGTVTKQSGDGHPPEGPPSPPT